MIKDIVVNLSVDQGRRTRRRLRGLGRRRDRTRILAGVAFVYDPIVPVSGTGYIPAEVIERQQADNEADAKAAIDRFASGDQTRRRRPPSR